MGRVFLGKVVTSEGLTEFVQSGKFIQVPDHKAGDAVKPPEKPVEETKPVETKPAEAEKPPEVAVDENEGLEPEDHDLAERARKRIAGKHRAMKEAQEAAQDAERFAEQQFNERKLAEKRATDAEARAKELEAKVAPPEVKPEFKAPSIEDFKDKATGQVDWDKYTDAKSDYAAKKAVADYEKEQGDKRAKADFEVAKARVIERVENARKAHSDYERVVESVKGTAADQVPQHVLNYLWESESGEELRYYLMKSPAEAERISKLSPIRGLAELGKLEAKLTEPAKPAATGATAEVNRKEPGGAPAPITPLSGEGSTGIVTDPAKMDFKQLRQFRREEAQKRRERR